MQPRQRGIQVHAHPLRQVPTREKQSKKLTSHPHSCLTSYCPSHTAGICEASLALSGLCALARSPGPTLTGVTCPTDLPDLLANIVPSEVRSLIPSGLTGLASTEIPFRNGPGEGTTGSATATEGADNASASDSGSSAGRVGDLEGVLAAGVAISVVIGGLAAWL